MDPAPAELPDETGQQADDRLAPFLEAYHDALLAADTDAAQSALDATVSTADLDVASQASLVGAQQVLRTLVRARSIVPIARSSHAEGERDSTGKLSVWEALSRASGDELPLRQLGRFTIQCELGRGGFSLVFLAHDPVLNRDVALKVPRPEVLITEGVRLRFDHEARAVARLTHPNLVPLFEVGEAGAIAYILSAYCPGPTLAQLLHKRGGPVAPCAAARMVEQLADAVHYAHTQGVLHRDIKPGNVLLEPLPAAADALETSGAGENLPFVPKLVDFGLAKLDEADRVDTRAGTALGTPGYMAPEQVEGRGAAMGPATDVYGLGVLLYESLTGARPFVGSNDTDTFRRILSEAPLRPTNRVPQLSRDLEAICLKCLEKNPDRRYLSAAQLADDLRRYLSGRSTLARPIGLVGTAGRWARRNSWVAGLVTTVALLLLVIIVGSAVTAVQMARMARREHQSAQSSLMAKNEALSAAERAVVAERQAERDAVEARTQAQVALDEKKGADSIATFLTGLFTSSDTSGLSGLGLRRPDDLGKSLTARDLLERGAVLIEEELRDQPVPRARILTALGGVCLRMEMLDLAEKLLNEANEIRLAPGLPLPPRETAAVLVELGSLRRRQRRYREAEELLRAGIQLREGLAAGQPAMEVEVTDARFELAWAISDAQNIATAVAYRSFDEVLGLFEKCLADYERLLGAGDPKTAAAMTGVLAALTSSGQAEAIKERSPQALEIYAQQEGGDLVAKAITAAMQGHLERSQFQLDEAIVEYEESIAHGKEALGPDHPLLGVMLGELAGTLKQAGRYADADATIQEALELGWRIAPHGHPLMVTALVEVAGHRTDQFDYEAADRAGEQAHGIALQYLDQAPWLALDSLRSWMLRAMGPGDLAKLQSAWDELFRLREKVGKSYFDCLMFCTESIAGVASDESLGAVIEQLQARGEKELSAGERGALHERLGVILLQRQRPEQALAQLNLAVDHLVGPRGTAIPPPAFCIRNLVEAELATGDLENAELDARWHVTEAAGFDERFQVDVIGANATLAKVLTSKRDFVAAREYALAAHRLAMPDPNNSLARIQSGSISTQLADLEQRLGNRDAAVDLFLDYASAVTQFFKDQQEIELAYVLVGHTEVCTRLRALDFDTTQLEREWSAALAGFRRRPLLAEAIGTAAAILLAGPHLEEALALCELVHNDTHLPANAPTWRIRRDLEKLHGICLTKLGRFEPAEVMLLTNLDEVRRGAGDHHVITHGVLTALVDLYAAWGKSDLAEEFRRLADER
jgi:tetratricopeptide (TPR) repeat protein